MNSCAVEQLPLINFTPLLDINSNRLLLLSCPVPAITQITNAVSDHVALCMESPPFSRQGTVSITKPRSLVLKLFVSSIPYKTTEAELFEVFQSHGTVSSVTLLKNKKPGIRKGSGYIEMPNPVEAKAAILALHEQKFKGRFLSVMEARPTPQKPALSEQNAADSGTQTITSPQSEKGSDLSLDKKPKFRKHHPKRKNKPGGAKRKDKPGGFKRDDRPGGFKRDDRPSGFKRDDRPGGFKRDDKPSGFKRNDRPGGFKRPENPHRGRPGQ